MTRIPIADTAPLKIMVEEIDKNNNFKEKEDLHYLGLLKLLAQELPDALNPIGFMRVYKDSFDMTRDIEGMDDAECAKVHFRMTLLIDDVFPWDFSEKIADSLKAYLN